MDAITEFIRISLIGWLMIRVLSSKFKELSQAITRAQLVTTELRVMTLNCRVWLKSLNIVKAWIHLLTLDIALREMLKVMIST